MRIPQLGPGAGSGLGLKWQQIAQVFKNADSVTIPPGVPVILNANGTEDGVAVVLPSTAATANTNQVPDLCMGISGVAIPASSLQDVVCYGMVTNARVVLQTRSASTAAFASWGAIAVGDWLQVETVNNGLSRSSSGGSLAQQAVFVAMQSFASGTTQASTYTQASATTVASGLYVTAKVFVRAM